MTVKKKYISKSGCIYKSFIVILMIAQNKLSNKQQSVREIMLLLNKRYA